MICKSKYQKPLESLVTLGRQVCMLKTSSASMLMPGQGTIYSFKGSKRECGEWLGSRHEHGQLLDGYKPVTIYYAS